MELKASTCTWLVYFHFVLLQIYCTSEENIVHFTPFHLCKWLWVKNTLYFSLVFLPHDTVHFRHHLKTFKKEKLRKFTHASAPSPEIKKIPTSGDTKFSVLKWKTSPVWGLLFCYYCPEWRNKVVHTMKITSLLLHSCVNTNQIHVHTLIIHIFFIMSTFTLYTWVHILLGLIYFNLSRILDVVPLFGTEYFSLQDLFMFYLNKYFFCYKLSLITWWHRKSIRLIFI